MPVPSSIKPKELLWKFGYGGICTGICKSTGGEASGSSSKIDFTEVFWNSGTDMDWIVSFREPRELSMVDFLPARGSIEPITSIRPSKHFWTVNNLSFIS